MQKIFNFFKTHKYAIIWTICYGTMMYVILAALFNFNMFSGIQWNQLFHAKLRGFPGFVFGILILSALPIYIATTALIVRTKKPLFSVPVPNFIKTVWTRMQPTLINPPSQENQDTPPPETEKKPSDDLPAELPTELRTAYIRARLNITPEQRSAFNCPTPTNIPDTPTPDQTQPPEITDIPLPTDFDVAPSPDAETIFADTNFSTMAAPTFSDISFADDQAFENDITQYLDTKSTAYKVVDDLVITDKHIIASHTDNDFWICEDDVWFAPGTQRKSPIPELIQTAEQENLTPVLYLGATNIMNLDELRTKWESMGIKIITSPDQISE